MEQLALDQVPPPLPGNADDPAADASAEEMDPPPLLVQESVPTAKQPTPTLEPAVKGRSLEGVGFRLKPCRVKLERIPGLDAPAVDVSALLVIPIHRTLSCAVLYRI